MNWIKRIFSEKEKPFKIPERYKHLGSRNPDKPINFGIKTIWCAVKSDNHLIIADFLKFDKTKTCNWIEGTIRAYEWGVFIMPAINNWVIIHGWGLPIPNTQNDMRNSDKFLNSLSKEFGEAQMFGNHRVSSSAFWMKSEKGELKRIYIVGDGTGGMIGEPTEIERKWNLIDCSSPKIDDKEYRDNHLYPGEDEVIEVAGNWSVNPMEIESIENVGKEGIYGRIKN